MASLASDGERNVFSVYYRAFKDLGDKLPALTPQVYLHYDPYTLAQRGGVGRLSRQRMDFLLLFSDTGRVVVEVDGSQHFAEDGKLSLARYAEMVAADRDLRLAGYEVYRFGANELTGHGSSDRQIVRSSDRQIVRSSDRIESFFRQLLRKHAILPGGWGRSVKSPADPELRTRIQFRKRESNWRPFCPFCDALGKEDLVALRPTSAEFRTFPQEFAAVVRR